MSGVTELGYVRFGVSDLDAWRFFVTDLLGLELRDDINDGKLWVRIDYQHHRICIEQNDCDDLLAMGLRVAGREEFRELQGVLTEANIAFEVGDEALAIDRQVLEIMMLEDPAGNPIEIYHGPHIEPQMPFYPARRRHGKFVTGDGGLGHMIVRDRDADEAYEFYKLLGLRSASEFRVPVPPEMGGYIRGRFMHCDHPTAREHTIAFGLERAKRINHLLMETDNIDDVMVTYERLKAHGEYPIMLDIGRHPNDQQMSFYVRSPSGFLIEIGYGGGALSNQSYILNGDYWGHAPNPEFPAAMGSVDEQRK